MTLPPALQGRYQLVVLGDLSSPETEANSSRLRNAVKVAFRDLGVFAQKFLTEITPGSAEPDIDRRMPTVAVFLGLTQRPTLSNVDVERLASLLEDGSLIIPVVADVTKFSELVPPAIAHLNGIGIDTCGKDFERLAARVLEGFGLLRERRRLFISYRRVETSGVATQLYEALDAGGFDVFLDTQGILRPGEPFQDVLWHRLADTDVALILDSPGFLESRWTEEELARASSSNIQMLQVLWPGCTDASAAAFSAFHPLGNADFEGGATLGPVARLVDSSVAQIVDAVEGLRARAIGARHAFLVREFLKEARKADFQVHMTLERILILSTDVGDKLIQAAIGVPDAERYETLEALRQRQAGAGRSCPAPAILLYDQSGIRAQWLKHLAWLNENLSCVHSVGLADARAWLETLKSGGAA